MEKAPYSDAIQQYDLPQQTWQNPVVTAPEQQSREISSSFAIKTYIHMIGATVLAISVAIIQHFIYAQLHGKPVHNQTGISAAGNALSYVSKLLFAYSLTICFVQWFWKQLRSQVWRLSVIDEAFALENKPLNIFSLDLLSNLSFGILIAVSLWVLPLVPVLVSSSLSVKQATIMTENVPIPIQNLNLSRTRQNLGSSFIGYTVNFEVIQGTGAAFNTYMSPSSRATGLAYSTVYNGRLPSLESPCGANCTFSQSFYGPSYKCTDIDYSQEDIPGDPFAHGSKPGYNFLSPSNNAFDVIWYAGRNSTCESGTTCFEKDNLWREGKIWILYQWLKPEYRLQQMQNGQYTPTNASFIPDSAWERHHLLCQSYNASYIIQRTYQKSQGTIKKNITYLNPLDFANSQTNTGDKTPAYAGYAIHQTLFSILQGEISVNGRFQPTDTTSLGGTLLVEEKPFPQTDVVSGYPNNQGYNGIQKPIQSLAAAIEELHANITIGMLSIPNLVYLQNETALATLSRSETQWNYSPRVLLIVFGCFIAANLFAIALAIRAILDNDGVGIMENGFVRMLMTTRNPHFDHLVGFRGRGEDHQQKTLADQKVEFGRIVSPNQFGHAPERIGFGLAGSVNKLK